MHAANIEARLERICQTQSELLDELAIIGRIEGTDNFDYSSKLQRAVRLDGELIQLLRALEGE